MNLVLDVLRDPIWQFISVVIPVLSAVVIYAYRKLRSRKNQTNADTNSSTAKPVVRKLKPGEELMLILFTMLSIFFSQVLIVRVFDTNIPFGNDSGNIPLFLAIFLVIGLITYAVYLLDYDLAVYIHMHFSASCVIAALLLMGCHIDLCVVRPLTSERVA
jgi:magnesium-transporting ATPase (P-type)